MKKLSVLCFIGGTEDGFDNGAGSEQRYLFALAEMLAYYGHEVTCVGNSHNGEERTKWGDTTPIPGIKFIHMREVDFLNRAYDLAIVSENIIHWRCDGQPIQTPCPLFEYVAKKVAHPLFGWAGTGLDCVTERTADNTHFVFQPFEPLVMRQGDAVINYPVWKDAPADNLEGRDTLVWSCKDVYHDDWKEDHNFHYGGLKILKALKRLETEHSIRSVFINSEKFNGKRATRMGAKAIFDSLEKKEAHTGLIRKSVLDAAFKRARVSTIVQGYFSSAFSAPAAGAVPLYFNDHGGTIWHPDQIIMSMWDSEEVFYRKLERFFIDDSYYLERRDKGLEVIKKFHFAESHKSFLRFAEKVGLNA